MGQRVLEDPVAVVGIGGHRAVGGHHDLETRVDQVEHGVGDGHVQRYADNHHGGHRLVSEEGDQLGSRRCRQAVGPGHHDVHVGVKSQLGCRFHGRRPLNLLDFGLPGGCEQPRVPVSAPQVFPGPEGAVHYPDPD